MAPLIQEVDDEFSQPKSLELTEVESTLRKLLLDVATYIDENPASSQDSQVALPDHLTNEPITLRFTGGWVRDKLLGVASHDIDVAINKMTGFQFGLRLKEYLETPGNPEKYGLEGLATTEKQSAKAGTTDKSKTVGGLHKIEANPEKSKHLETVTTRILGLDIDLVNLRKETYTDESRNPQMEFGTPEEDALRRDATVNAMFYNINTQQIEDFTGQGFDDMASKIIRTPLEPHSTFKDDPLRVLRLIRFASRLSYKIDSAALKAMGDTDIKDALRKKISRERVGVELEKALRGPDPHEAMRLIVDLGLYYTIFSDPTVSDGSHYQPHTGGLSMLIDELKSLLESGDAIPETLTTDADERYMAWILAAMVPYRDAPQPEPPEPGRRAPPPVPTSVAREGIKSMNKVCDIITSSVRHQSEISALADAVDARKRQPQKSVQGENPTARDVLGMAIRKWGATWRSQVLYAMLVDTVEHPDSFEGKTRLDAISRQICTDIATPATSRKYTTFVNLLRDLDLLSAPTLKPLIDGKALAKALETPPGPWMKDALDVVMAWQLRNPDVQDPAGAIEAVKKHGELTSALTKHFLALTIRPLFAKAKLDSVTPAGRKNIDPGLPPKMGSEREEDTKPWKQGKEGHALGLLGWCVKSLSPSTTEQFWPLVVPPILTLLDDWEVRYKIVGARLLHSLLLQTPPALLSRTGLGEVFEQALLPCLTYLPELTPVLESVQIIDAVYPALFTLSTSRFPLETTPDSKASPETLRIGRVACLDTVLRRGIFHTYQFCSQYPAILTTTFTHLATCLRLLGIDSVKHLRFIIPMLTESLAHPTMASQPKTLLAAVKAMQSVVLSSWPRMKKWRGEMLKGLCLCWINLDEREDNEELRKETREAVKMLKAALGDEVDWDAETTTLIEADGRVQRLFT